MSSPETNIHSGSEKQLGPENHENKERVEKHIEHLESKAESAHESQREQLEHARHEVKKIAPEIKPHHEHAPRTSSPPGRKEKEQTYKHTLSSVQRELPTRFSRSFSKVIHQPVIEKASDISGKTIFRPSLMLGTTLGALIGGSAFYLLAKRYGFPISGSEFLLFGLIGAFFGLAGEGLRYLFKKISHKTA